MERYDFSGWATRNNLKCSDGRTILKDAFKHCDGLTVPLVWSHQHDKPEDVLGHALLENREEGVYAYCSFNETESGELAKVLVKHGDIKALSIYANQLKQDSSKRVMHGCIREVSLVHAGANPGAIIENVIVHSDTGEFIREIEDEGVIYNGENIELYHADEQKNQKKEETDMAEETKKPEAENKEEKTIADVVNTMTEEQKTAMYAIIGQALEDAANENNDDDSKGGNESMKHNVFDQDTKQSETVLTHADKQAIVELAKQSGVSSLKTAINIYLEENETLKHAFNQSDADTAALLFPEPHLINPGAPEIIRDYDVSWVAKVINKIQKSPFSKIRTRKADARSADLRAKGYQKKGDQKTIMGQIKLLKRETQPQTVYIKDELHRDDIIDIDWDVVEFQWGVMRDEMNETLAISALVGDGRDDADPDKIHEANIRSIYNDDDFYCMHVDLTENKENLQGSDTMKNFGEEFIYSEAAVKTMLDARVKFKGTGAPTLYASPYFVNKMLLARDLNGRRIYADKAELARVLNVNEIIEIEQLAGKTRVDKEGKTRKLLGLFVNLADYQYGSAKGGEITKFDDFDINYNTYDYLMETRLSGALNRIESAIALEEYVEVAAG